MGWHVYPGGDCSPGSAGLEWGFGHDGFAFGCWAVAFADVACSAADHEVGLFIGSAFRVRDDVVYLCSVECSPVRVVEADLAVGAVSLPLRFGLVEG